MKIKKFSLLMVLLAAVFMLIGCGSPEEVNVEEPAAAPRALVISGNVSEELSWTLEELQSLDTMDVDYTGKDGETETYTGVGVADLIDEVSPAEDATTILLIASDDYQAEADLGEVLSCADCVVAFDGDSLRMVMPDFSGKLQVRNLVQLEIQ